MPDRTLPGQSLHTGFGVIDSQHQTFFTLLQRLRQKELKNNQKDLSELINELHLYTLYHFETEEALLEQHNLPAIEEHKEQHQLMVEKIEEFRLQNITDSHLLAEQMCDFLEEWLIEHIQKRDKEDLNTVKKTASKQRQIGTQTVFNSTLKYFSI